MADELIAALTVAYRPYVESVLEDRGIDVAIVDEALSEGEAWLKAMLDELLSRPFEDQRRGPLEVFQEAMRFPTDALRAAETPPISRDEVTANALPGDLYGLAPASSRDLGEDAWEAHLRWGARKAQALRDTV